MARKMRSDEEVTLNLASMLDMAFQLLAFFILTFQQPPPEGNILMRMPPPQAIAGIGKLNAGQDETKDPKDVKPVTTLTINLIDQNGGGGLDAIQVGVPGKGMDNVATVNDLEPKLAEYFRGSGDAFEQVIIQGSATLQWESMMKVVEICTKQRFSDGRPLTKLSFLQLGESK